MSTPDFNGKSQPPDRSRPEGGDRDASVTGDPGGSDVARGETLYRALLRGLYDAILIVEHGGVVIDCNRRAQSFFDYTLEEFPGAYIGRFVSGMTPELLGNVGRNLAAGRFTVLDAVCVRRDQTRFPSEITISRLSTDLRDNLVFSIRNITRRRAMEERLRTEHNALQNSASGIVITELNARITYANPAFLELVEATGDDVLGRDIRRFWASDPSSRALVEYPARGQNWTGELRSGKPSAARRIVQATASANRDAHEVAVGMVFSFVDITEQHAAQEAIRSEAQAQIQSARKQDSFSGRLNIIGLTDVMQLINTAGKTGFLAIFDRTGNETGRAAFRSGELVAASCGEKTGEPAVKDLLGAAEAGTFQFTPGVPPEQDEPIRKSLMSLMMEAAQALDEESA